MNFNVKFFYDFVANGHQIIPYDSCSPSKIPYGGFSPVRLQTGFQPRSSSLGPALKHITRIPSIQADLYATKVHLIFLPGSPPSTRHFRNGHPPSRGPWLARELCCPPGSSLTMASSEKLSVPPASLSTSSRWVFAPRYGSSRYREAPQFTLRVFLPVPPSVPRRTGWSTDCSFSIHTSLRLLCTGSASASSTRRFSMGRL